MSDAPASLLQVLSASHRYSTAGYAIPRSGLLHMPQFAGPLGPSHTALVPRSEADPPSPITVIVGRQGYRSPPTPPELPTNPHSTSGPTVDHLSRVLSLEAFRRRPQDVPHRRDRPASENLHKSGREHLQ